MSSFELVSKDFGAYLDHEIKLIDLKITVGQPFQTTNRFTISIFKTFKK